MLLAQAAGLSLVQLAILIVVLAGIVGIVIVILKQVGVTIPPFIVAIFWIVLAVVVGVLAIKFIWSIL